jgi:hypothetical protein
MAKGVTHEDFTRAGAAVPVGSERSFGLVFAAVFTIIALLPLKDGEPVRLWALAVAAVFAVAALLLPRLLKPLNLLWFRFGMVLHHIVTPLVMGLLFFVTVTPVGVLMRLSGKDPMRLKADAGAASYWIARQPPGPAPETMKQQF